MPSHQLIRYLPLQYIIFGIKLEDEQSPQLGGNKLSFKTNVLFNEEEQSWILMPEGDMDIYTSATFKEDVLSSFEKTPADLVIDGEKLDYIDSTGLGALIGILKRVKETDHNIYLHNVKPNIKKLFDITELDKLFIFRGDNNE